MRTKLVLFWSFLFTCDVMLMSDKRVINNQNVDNEQGTVVFIQNRKNKSIYYSVFKYEIDS